MTHKAGSLALILIFGGLGFFGALISIWLLLYMSTSVGRSLALIGLALAILPVLLLGRWLFPSQHRVWRWSGVITCGVIIGMSLIILLTTPDGMANENSPVSHHFVGETNFQRYSVANIIPEMEQVNMGFLLAPYLDPFITHRQVQRVSGFTLDLYQEMENNQDFYRLGSAMGWAYAELLGQPFNASHYYLYIPRNRADGPLPAILFLHGSGGNFKAYTWAWSKFAEAHGFVIIAPSFGFGNWLRPEGIDVALNALEDAAKFVSLDPDRIYVAGLSNGGLGVSRLGLLSPERFRGLIFLSPVMVTEIVDNEEFQALWNGRPVLVITGEDDRRIPVSYVKNRIARLQAGGVDVTYIPYPAEDHFLFFSQLTSVSNEISNWLSQ